MIDRDAIRRGNLPKKGQGFGTGFEMTEFEQELGDGTRRLAALVYWRGGGLQGVGLAAPSAPAWIATSSSGSAFTRPFRYLLLPLLPLAWIADKMIALRKKPRKPFVFVPMSEEVKAAREQAQYDSSTLTIGDRTFPVPDDATLIVFVEDDPSRNGTLVMTTHRIATESFTPSPGIDPVDRERLRATRDPKIKREILMKLAMERLPNERRVMMAIHMDPVCREFMRRASGDE